jgi:hypothetical protein
VADRAKREHKIDKLNSDLEAVRQHVDNVYKGHKARVQIAVDQSKVKAKKRDKGLVSQTCRLKFARTFFALWLKHSLRSLFQRRCCFPKKRSRDQERRMRTYMMRTYMMRTYMMQNRKK